jgi:uncharacterized protein
MQIAIISDTHMPHGGRRLPARCARLLARSELIIHAGDFMRLSILRELESFGELVAVHGNVDDPALRRLLPRVRVVEAAGVRIGVTHDGGQARGRLERLRKMFGDVDAVVFGHSHMPLHESAPDGFQIFNPGSPTERRRAPRHTMGIAHVDRDEVAFELIELD